MKMGSFYSAFALSLIALSLMGCDDKAVNKNSSPANNIASTPAQQRPAVPQSQKINDEKIDIYASCFNEIDNTIYESTDRYVSWLSDYINGPTGKEVEINGTYPIDYDISMCEADVARAQKMLPGIKAMDDIAGKYIASAKQIIPLINEMNDYYQGNNYKNDHFKKGKNLHKRFVLVFDEFEKESKEYSTNLREINTQRQLMQLKDIEVKEGESFNYYALLMIVNNKEFNHLAENDIFDTDQAALQIKKLEGIVLKLREKEQDGLKGGEARVVLVPAFIRDAQEYVINAKSRVRRVKDNVPYTEEEESLLQDSPEAVDGTYQKMLESFNKMILSYNNFNS
ncbi:YiiG family protein [Enterobacter hormaechei]|nr:YiiG family protein [Enterobacter hormaechei]